MKAGWALCKQTGQKCCNVQNWNSNPRGRGRGVGGGMWDTHQRCVNPMGLSEWKLPHWETCRLPTSRAKASQGTVCSLIHVQTSPGHPASQALCLKQRRVKKKKEWGGEGKERKPPDSGFYNFPDIGLLSGKLHPTWDLSLVIPRESLLPSQQSLQSWNSSTSLQCLKMLMTSWRPFLLS